MHAHALACRSLTHEALCVRHNCLNVSDHPKLPTSVAIVPSPACDAAFPHSHVPCTLRLALTAAVHYTPSACRAMAMTAASTRQSRSSGTDSQRHHWASAPATWLSSARLSCRSMAAQRQQRRHSGAQQHRHGKRPLQSIQYRRQNQWKLSRLVIQHCKPMAAPLPLQLWVRVRAAGNGRTQQQRILVWRAHCKP